ncbi:hypothetical protein [Streptomyces sp. NPDC056524]|uniref:hypothetical protein n=1 Tax=Streptomyces sp. NPDC056524 TaxID=3345851 RepID=UPI003674FE37
MEGAVITTGAFCPDLDHLDPQVPTDPEALAEAMDPDGDGSGRNIPNLYAHLCAQEPESYPSGLWKKACSAYDLLHARPRRRAAPGCRLLPKGRRHPG